MTKLTSGLILFIAYSAAGCEDGSAGRVPVAGKVLIDGQPLTEGTIRFVPKAGRPASSAIQADGSFTLVSANVDSSVETGVPPGRYQVQVSSSTIVDDETIHWRAPQRYADFRTSGLNVTIDKPTSDLLIELSSNADEQAEAKDAASTGDQGEAVDATENSGNPIENAVSAASARSGEAAE